MIGRIHFCHSYPNLDFAARRMIWQDFMKRTRETQTGVSIDVTDDGIDKLAEMSLNGRQVSLCRETEGCVTWRLTTPSCKRIRSRTQ